MPRPPQRIASPFLLLFSAIITIFGLAIAVNGVVERNLDAISGGLVFLALGAGGVVQVVRPIAGGQHADDDPHAPDPGNRPVTTFTPRPEDLEAAQRARGAAMLLTWCLVALSLYISFFTQLPHIVAVLTFFGGFAPYLASIKVIEPWLLRRNSTQSR